MEPRVQSIDKAVHRYAPKYPEKRRHWIKNFVIGAIVVWFAGFLAYGIPVLVRHTNITDSLTTVAHNTAHNDLMRMLAGQNPIDNQSNLDQLAAELRALRGNGYPDMVGLRKYSVYPGQFARAIDQLGYPITTQADTRQDYGHFTPTFINDTVQAVPGQVESLIKPTTSQLRYWGNFRWQWLALASGGYWLVVGLVCLLLVIWRWLWVFRARRRFVASLDPQDREVLRVVSRILEKPDQPGYWGHLTEADGVFELVRHRYDQADAEALEMVSDPTVEQQLTRLRQIYGGDDH